jgi:hypothetical protein
MSGDRIIFNIEPGWVLRRLTVILTHKCVK